MTTEPEPTFQQLFGGATGNVDYLDEAAASMPFLPTPEHTDDLDTTARKMRALAEVVEQGKSLAVRTGYRQAAHTDRDPETIGRAAMTPKETTQYDAWKRGIILPTIDWSTARKAVHGGANSQNRLSKRADAMKHIWRNDAIDAENAAWLTSELSYAIPLVIAVSKVQAAARELCGGQDELTAMELAEVQTAHRIIAVGTDNMNIIGQRFNQLSRDINNSKEIIQAREHSIKSKMAGYKRKQDPINRTREFVGLKPIGPSVDYGAATTGNRIARTTLLGGTGLPAPTQAPAPAPAPAPPAPIAPPAKRPRRAARVTRTQARQGTAPPPEEMDY